MITQTEKDRKIKLIALILIVQYEYSRRNPFKNGIDSFCFAVETLSWVKELNRVNKLKVFEKCGLAIVGENREEIIIRK